jgi:hypothetical protein
MTGTPAETKSSRCLPNCLEGQLLTCRTRHLVSSLASITAGLIRTMTLASDANNLELRNQYCGCTYLSTNNPRSLHS